MENETIQDQSRYPKRFKRKRDCNKRRKGLKAARAMQQCVSGIGPQVTLKQQTMPERRKGLGQAGRQPRVLFIQQTVSLPGPQGIKKAPESFDSGAFEK